MLHDSAARSPSTRVFLIVLLARDPTRFDVLLARETAPFDRSAHR
jgi:hypothetical protein